MGGLSLSLGLGLGAYRSGGGFSPASLFAASEPGAWYDPSDLSTMFQDTAGTTPVTATGQTVGLVLDKSQGLVLGPDIETNAWSSPPAGVTYSEGTFTFDGVTSQANVVFSTNTPAVAIVVGRTYQVSFTIFANTTAQVGVDVGGVLGDAQTVPGTYTRLVTATSTTGPQARFRTNVSVRTGSMGNISVKELPGNHATQATAASRPIYGIEPFGGRRNLLTFTEQFDNAAWAKTAVTANGTEIRETTANSGHAILQVVSLTGTYTFSLELQAVGRDVYTIWMGTTSGTFAFIYTFSTNTITSVGTALSNVTATVLSGGWVRFTGNVVTPNRFQVSVGGPGASYVGDPANGFNIRNAQLETGSTATAYQRVTDQWNVTEAGVPSVSYLAFDGTDDFLVTGIITPGIDKAQVFAGVRKLSDAGLQSVIGLSASPGVSNGTFEQYFNLMAAGSSLFLSRGTLNGSANGSAGTAPNNLVLAGLMDIAGDSVVNRINGVQAATSPTDQGTGNYLAYPLYIGRRGGTSLPFNGRIYQMIVRFGANLTAERIEETELFISGKTGVYTLKQLNKLATLDASGTSYSAYAATDADSNNYLVPKTVLNADGTSYLV